MAKRILLIGASKHIGFHILEDIASQKDQYELFVLARTAKERIADFKGKENVTFIQGDAKDQNNVNNVINSTMQGRVDYIVVTIGTLHYQQSR
jgi:short-subunit dehydrogenase